uniref:Uncharacterized protein n=1 Tax=Arundo donax TaxID=35708 RepID=A0A0A9DK93_ARUDO
MLLVRNQNHHRLHLHHCRSHRSCDQHSHNHDQTLHHQHCPVHIPHQNPSLSYVHCHLHL